MVATKFTPGPWHFSEDDGNIQDDAERGIVSVRYAHMEDEYTANANLIAAAPEMYAKLDKVATWLESNAAKDESSAKTCNFESLKQAYIADAKNYRATAKDIRQILAKADGVRQ